MPRVSVIMATYNQVQYIEEAVEGLLDQSFEDFELIIINDGSDDGTPEYLETLTDPRIRILHQENQGAIATINRGIRESVGELVTPVSSDNTYFRHFLESFVLALDSHEECDFAYSAYITIDADGKFVENIGNNNLSYRKLVFGDNERGCSGLMYRKKIHDEVGYFDENHAVSADTDMWRRIFGRFETVYVMDPTCCHRLHEDSLAASRGDEISSEITSSFERNVRSGELNDLRKLYDNGLKTKDDFVLALCDFGSICAEYGAPQLSASYYSEAARLAPRNLLPDVLFCLASVFKSDPENIRKQAAQALANNPNISENDRTTALSHIDSTADVFSAFGSGQHDRRPRMRVSQFERFDRFKRRTFSKFEWDVRNPVADG